MESSDISSGVKVGPSSDEEDEDDEDDEFWEDRRFCLAPRFLVDFFKGVSVRRVGMVDQRWIGKMG